MLLWVSDCKNCAPMFIDSNCKKIRRVQYAIQDFWDFLLFWINRKHLFDVAVFFGMFFTDNLLFLKDPKQSDVDTTPGWSTKL